MGKVSDERGFAPIRSSKKWISNYVQFIDLPLEKSDKTYFKAEI